MIDLTVDFNNLCDEFQRDDACPCLRIVYNVKAGSWHYDCDRDGYVKCKPIWGQCPLEDRVRAVEREKNEERRKHA